ncbi:glycosyltransferase family 1 protein [bacterium]|nr:glycosyltransferase family 1 protein [bacterium]NBX50056.1 glycosyltransferase family 1 protein [bacterium]
MNIAIDASRSIESVQKTGVEVVSDAVLSHLEKRRRDDVNFVYYTPKEIPWLPQSAQRIIERTRLWTIVGLSHALLRDKSDALFVPVHTLPFFCPKKTVRVIHDVSFLRHPEAYSWRERSYMKFDLWRAKRICIKVIVPTEAVRRDLVELLSWPAEKIVVTGWGVPEVHHSSNPSSSVPSVHTPFILFIGRIEEKKNVANIIRGFKIFKELHPEWELVLAGKPGHGFEVIEPLLSTPGVRHLGYIAHEKKVELLASASMLTLISKEEGFAFPMLEAFQANVPVLASSIPTLTEIAEDAALFADPTDIKKIAENMATLADDKELCAMLVQKGTEKLKKYSWESVTEKIWQTLVE